MVALVSVAAATAWTVRGGEVAVLSEVVPAGTAEVVEVESVGAVEVVEVLGHQPLGFVAGGAVWPLLSAECSDALARVSGAGLL